MGIHIAKAKTFTCTILIAFTWLLYPIKLLLSGMNIVFKDQDMRMFCLKMKIGENLNINPSKPEFTIVIFIHYKPRIAVAIPDV